MTPQTTRDDFECIFVDGILLERKKRKKKNHAGSKTLPASIKEKEAHWPEVHSVL